MKDWYSPKEVSAYTPDVIIWVLTRLVYCSGHAWPTEPSSSYDAGGKRSRNTSTSFRAVSEACAELEARLELTGLDGEKLVQQIVAEKELDYDCLSALYFCVGKKRKRMGYNEWRNRKHDKAAARKWEKAAAQGY